MPGYNKHISYNLKGEVEKMKIMKNFRENKMKLYNITANCCTILVNCVILPIPTTFHGDDVSVLTKMWWNVIIKKPFYIELKKTCSNTYLKATNERQFFLNKEIQIKCDVPSPSHSTSKHMRSYHMYMLSNIPKVN